MATDSLARLKAALASLDDAVDCCVSVAWLGSDIPLDVRRAAHSTAMDAYEAAATLVDALLAAIIAAGGCTGLLDALTASTRRASERDAAAMWRRMEAGYPRPGDLACRVTDHALALAWERHQRATEAIVMPWLRRRTEAAIGHTD